MADRSHRSPLAVLAGTGIAGLVLAILEIVVLVWVAGEIGWWTLLAIFGTTLIGLVALVLIGKSSYKQFRTAIKAEEFDDLNPADTGLGFVGGVLMVLPGFVTDAIGLLMVVPFTRPVFHKLGSWYLRQLAQPIVTLNHRPESNVIRGEVVEEAPTTNDDGPLVIEGTVVDEDRGTRD